MNNNPAFQLFIQESLELLQEIKEGLQRLSQQPNPEATEILLKATQMIQGGASQEKFSELSILTRRLEQILGYLFREQVDVDDALTEQLLTICDCIQSLLDNSTSNPQDSSLAVAKAEPVLTDLELRLSHPHPNPEDIETILQEIAETLEMMELALVMEEGDLLSETLKDYAQTLIAKGRMVNRLDIVSMAESMLTGLSVNPKSAHYIGHIALGGLHDIRELIETDQTSTDDFDIDIPTPKPGNQVAPASTLAAPHPDVESLSAPQSSMRAQTKVEDPPQIPFILPSEYTLKVNQQLVWRLDSTVFTLPYESIQEYLGSNPDEIFQIGNKQYLEWQNQMLPLWRLSDLLKDNLIMPGVGNVRATSTSSAPYTPLRCVVKVATKFVALECPIEQLITESELVINPFAAALSPAEHCYGFTALDANRLATVVNVMALLKQSLDQPSAAQANPTVATSAPDLVEDALEPPSCSIASSVVLSRILVIDQAHSSDSNLVQVLRGLGYPVTQLHDGHDAIAQLRSDSTIKLVICEFDTANPNELLHLNDLMFLTYRAKDVALAKIPVAWVNPCPSNQLKKTAMMMGVTTFLTPPCDDPSFGEQVKQLLPLESKHEKSQ